jgi:hypothetical protein
MMLYKHKLLINCDWLNDLNLASEHQQVYLINY